MQAPSQHVTSAVSPPEPRPDLFFPARRSVSSIFLVRRDMPVPIEGREDSGSSLVRNRASGMRRATAPIWTLPPVEPPRKGLDRDVSVDCCVIGAGFSGLTVAYLMAREGRKVVVLDEGVEVGAGEAGRTTAHLSSAMDARFTDIERIHGAEGARDCVASRVAAITRIEKIAASERIACDFERVPGYVFMGPGPGQGMEALEAEMEAARRSGLGDVELLPRAPRSPFDTGPCLRFRQQAQIHPLKYLRGLASAVERAGGVILGGARVEGIEGDSPVRIRVRGGLIVTASDAVIANSGPMDAGYGAGTRAGQAAHRVHVVAVRVPRGSVSHALYWDTSDAGHHVRVAPGEFGSHHDHLVVSGDEHGKGQADDAEEGWSRLAFWARLRFPMLADVVARWSREILQPLDGIASIGRDPSNEHVFIATGDGGMGMTHGMIAGILITDLACGRDNAWQEFYDPSRRRLRSLADPCAPRGE